jgi:signal transduction histidine kinase
MYQLYGPAIQNPTAFDFERTAREVVSLLTRVARKRGVALKMEISGRIPSVELPQGEVKQVLYNLILNAIQASPDGESVGIRVVADRDEICVEIQDRGPGIPPDVLPRIFDPFFSTKTNAAQGGMGLGLSVSQSVMEALGGRIEVDGNSPQGIVFSAIFPFRAARSPEGITDGSDQAENPDR